MQLVAGVEFWIKRHHAVAWYHFSRCEAPLVEDQVLAPEITWTLLYLGMQEPIGVKPDSHSS